MATSVSSSTLSFQNPNPNFLLASKPPLPSLVRLPLHSPSPNRLRLCASSAPPPSTNPLYNTTNSLSSILSHLATQLGDVSFYTTTTPRFFAALMNRRAELLIPITAVVAGVARWLDIYSGVLMVRVLLSWYPNIPWDRQPFSAFSDLCDPYLNLFRKITPQVFGAMDLSPILAFAVLGMLKSLLSTNRVMY
ncbi:hypothetical protein J5N97_010651 [Dioscorea zingiberensis]|uniref:YGGT family protein n=1 Tax=Dioscorea zingiberensis TaxID=325984 RepID=A0A9D5HMZ7_9LILI|nr:hypothetical protein J5N97_010651 [Dioscorea zingiberensis]